MNRFHLNYRGLRVAAQLLCATAIVAVSASAGATQTNAEVPRGDATIWFVQPKVTLAGEAIEAGRALSLDVPRAAAAPDEPQRTAQAAETSGDAPPEDEGDSQPDADPSQTDPEAAQDQPETGDGSSTSDGSTASEPQEAGTEESEAQKAESAVEPEQENTGEVEPEESAILPSAEDQEETEAKTMATDCVKRPEDCLTPLEGDVEGPSLSETPQTPQDAETDADGATPVTVEN